MSPRVNLLPAECRARRARAARKRGWTFLFVALCAVLVVGVLARFNVESNHSRHEQQLADLEARQAELDRQMTLVARERRALYDRARLLASLRQSCALPEQLLALARDCAPSIRLTDLRAQALELPSSVPPANVVLNDRGSKPAAASAAPTSQPGPAFERKVNISGFAASHEELKRFLDVVARVPHWSRVELSRAGRDPAAPTDAVAFRIECRDREESP